MDFLLYHKKSLISQAAKSEFTIRHEKQISLNACGLHVLTPCSLFVSSRQRHVL